MGIPDESSAIHANNGTTSVFFDVMICGHHLFMH